MMETQLKVLSQTIEEQIVQIDLPSSPPNLYQPLHYFMQIGGKRIRPILTLLSAKLFNGKIEQAISASLAIEYFHNFSLIHDDIMDEAPLRRGKETVHTKWNANIAILSGDVLLIKAYQELAKQDSKHLADLLFLFNKTAIEVCEGQQMDMDFETQKDVSVSEYIEMIRLKTSVLLGCALEFGAIISDASKVERKLIYDFGQNIGIAFQIQDDILDLYGNEAAFGKQVGGDIISNKKTLLYLKALDLANPFQKEFLSNLQQINNPKDKVEQAKVIFAELGVKDTVLQIRNKYFEKGLNALDKINIPEDEKQSLKILVDFLKDREV